MGFTSQDDLITQLTVNGKGDTVVTTKTLSSAGTYSAFGLGFDLRYHGTDVDDVAIYDDRVIFSIKKAL